VIETINVKGGFNRIRNDKEEIEKIPHIWGGGGLATPSATWYEFNILNAPSIIFQ
jgi:hypothetical protein